VIPVLDFDFSPISRAGKELDRFAVMQDEFMEERISIASMSGLGWPWMWVRVRVALDGFLLTLLTLSYFMFCHTPISSSLCILLLAFSDD
jgi:hypothetical protein